MSDRAHPYLEYLYQAVSTPYGLVLESTDVPYTIRKLKEADTIALNPDFNFHIIASPTTEGQIWIIKREPDGKSPAGDQDPQPV